jgi:hypothetical protein
LEIYRLTNAGLLMSHIIHYEGKPRQKIIYYLAKVHQATKERILENVPDATISDIIALRYSKPPILETGGM